MSNSSFQHGQHLEPIPSPASAMTSRQPQDYDLSVEGECMRNKAAVLNKAAHSYHGFVMAVHHALTVRSSLATYIIKDGSAYLYWIIF